MHALEISSLSCSISENSLLHNHLFIHMLNTQLYTNKSALFLIDLVYQMTLLTNFIPAA